MLNKLIARFVRYIRQFYMDIDIEYWLNSRGNFVGRNGGEVTEVTVDTALLDCINNCRNNGINNAHDYTSKFRRLLEKREEGSIFIRENGMNYTVTIKYIQFD